MEETIRKLKQFIEQISKAEAEADVFRIQLFVTPGAKRKIFQSIDEAGLGQINYDDICTYCGKEGLNIPEGDWEIVGRYFRNWHKGITFDQFCEILNPRNLLTLTQEENTVQTPTSIFLNLIITVVGSYKELELIREELSLNSEMVIYHFEDCYRSGRGFTKDSLKTFMMNENIYSKQKFIQVAGYIFGQVQSKIPWTSFFGQRVNVKVPEQFQGEQQNPSCEEPEPDKTQEIPETKSKYKIEKSCKNIQEVLSQIEEIQKNLKEKKNKCQKKMVCDQKVTEKKSPLVGKVVSRQKTHKQEYQEQTYIKPVTFVKQAVQYQIPHSYIDKSSQQKRTFSYNASVGNLKRCASEAQMKIQQIQRRAMDKYLNARRSDYLPMDTYIPYYHERETRQNHQFGRLKNYENQGVGRIVNVNSKRTNPKIQIYSRNNVSRAWLYDNNEINYFSRPVSPRLLRY